MPTVENRKYEVTLSDGRVVSRQRAHQIKQGDTYKQKLKDRYQDPEYKKRKNEATKKWHEEFKEKYGMTYYQWRKENKQK